MSQQQTLLPQMAQKRPTAARKASGVPTYAPGPFKAPQGRVLSLDLGTNLGFAVAIDGKAREWGCKAFPAKNGAGQRWSAYRAWLSDTIREHGITEIVYEDVKNHAGTIAAHVYGGFLAYTEETAGRMLVKLHGVGVTEVKKVWTGSGAAKKDAMISGAIARGFRVNDDNVADSLAIMHFFGVNQ